MHYADVRTMPDKPYSLDALGAQLDPKTYQEWKEALNAKAQAFLKGESGMGSTFRRNATRTITDLLYRVEPNEVQKQQTRIDTALAKLKSQLGEIIASEDYCTQGIGPAGTMVDVPRGIAHQLKIDLEANTLGTPDGVIWRAVTVRTVPGAAAGDIAAKSRSVSPAVGRPREWDWDAAMAHLTAVAATKGALPAVQAQAERIVEKYFSDRHEGNSPAASGIRDRVGKVYGAIAQIKAKQEQKRGA
jgi:hypothetical protein